MLKPNRVSIALAAAALIVVPTLLAAPAIAQTKGYVVGDRNSRRNYREVRNPRDRRNWNRNNQPYSRVVRLRNGDIRHPNGQIIPARSLVRLRNQGYFRLPNGDILAPSQEIVPSRRLVRVRDNYFRLPSGLILQINR
ncbi:MAG: hypothetical protein ICV54_09275 [Nostoc sp. C3-bin3]|nr:hypothetical protein [Nostoc sp. C3-bin3]